MTEETTGMVNLMSFGAMTRVQWSCLVLADHLTPFTEHDALNALEQSDERVRGSHNGIIRARKASLKIATSLVRLHPTLSVLVGCLLGGVLGAILSGRRRFRPRHFAD